MKIGVVVEGRGEFKALPEIREQVHRITKASGFKVLFAAYDPHAQPGRIVRECESRIRQFHARGYNRVIVLVDRESRNVGCSQLAKDLEERFAKAQFPIPISVVVKDRRFENWLVADVDALKQMQGRFKITKGMRREIEPDRADRIDALRLLKKASQNGDFGKVDDARRIMQKADIGKMALNSRSFRCFLARLGHPHLANGSCQPAKG